MSNFISVPVVAENKMEATPPTGIPFTEQAMKIASGYWVGSRESNVYIGRVGNTLYFLSPYSGRKGYTWSNTTSFLVPFTVHSTSESEVFLASSIGIPFGGFSVDLTSYNSEADLINGFLADVIGSGAVDPGGGGGGGGGGASTIYVSVVVTETSNDYEVSATAYADGAETIHVTAVAEGKTTADPNASGGISAPSVPTGTFDDTSDPVPIQAIPDISAANVGLVSLFKPTRVELANLGSYLWTHLLDFIENLQKFFTNPMDYMIALNIMPCNPATGTPRRIKIGNFLTDITMAPVVSQWFEFNCGTIKINPYWGSALDYAPNTKVTMMLPFIGSVALNTDEVMGQNIGLVYRIDLLSGNCVAMVTINSDVVYQFTGECAVPVPMTASDWSRVYSAFVGAVVAVGVGAVGAHAAMSGATGVGNMIGAANAATDASKAVSAAGRAFSQVNQTSKGIAGVRAMRQDLVEAANLALQGGEMASSAPAQVGRALRASRIANTVNNVATTVMTGKQQIYHSGSISGSSGMLGNRIPYVMLEYPHQSLADNYKHYVGYPSNMTALLGTLSGYTECEQVIVSGITATDPELEEIMEALKGGVYL